MNQLTNVVFLLTNRIYQQPEQISAEVTQLVSQSVSEITRFRARLSRVELKIGHVNFFLFSFFYLVMIEFHNITFFVYTMQLADTCPQLHPRGDL